VWPILESCWFIRLEGLSKIAIKYLNTRRLAEIPTEFRPKISSQR